MESIIVKHAFRGHRNVIMFARIEILAGFLHQNSLV